MLPLPPPLMHVHPLPNTTGLSTSCVDLLEQMLHPDPAQRITIEGIKQHPWFSVGLDPALMGIKDACMGLPSPCELTLAKLDGLAGHVQQILLEQGLGQQQQQQNQQQPQQQQPRDMARGTRHQDTARGTQQEPIDVVQQATLKLKQQ
jgi:serine/threonine protein kinase